MKLIPLTRGKEAQVDDEDYDYLMQWSWSFAAGGYAVTSDGRYMHKLVADRKGLNTSLKTDHHDQNSLNNQRYNLREATQAQNGRNRGRNSNNTSGFKGVWWHEQIKRWRADIRVDHKKIYLGTFDTPVDAARAYNEAAVKHFGEFAFLNPV